jgi:hypothetical protein
MNLVPEAGNQIRTAAVAGPKLQDIKALCFGDFHLGQQMKVTRLSGRDPTDVESANDSEKPAVPHPQKPAMPHQQ